MPKHQDQIYYIDDTGLNWFLLNRYSGLEPIQARYLGREYTIQPPTELGTVLSTLPKGTALWSCVHKTDQDNIIGTMSLYVWNIADEATAWEHVGIIDTRHGAPQMLVSRLSIK